MHGAAATGSPTPPRGAAERLRASIPAIIDRWLARLPPRLAAAGGNARPILVDSLHTFVAELADALEPSARRGGAILGSSIPQEHGAQRVRFTHYRLDDLIHEYHLLRDVVLEALSAEGRPSPDESRAIVAGIDAGIVGAASAFMTAQLAARERLMTEVAHDLRHPLSTISTTAALLAEQPAAPETPRWAARIAVAVQSADHMLRDLLDASRVDAGHLLPLDLAPCDLVEVVRQAIGRQEALHGPRFALRAPAAVPGHWSPDALGRALDNLLANAVQYGAPATPITVTLDPHEAVVTVAVHNEGSYVDAGEREAIFEAFHRAGTIEGGRVRGWGIGLSIVRGAAEAHGGSMGLESDPARGTTFYLHLPVDAREARAGAAQRR